MCEVLQIRNSCSVPAPFFLCLFVKRVRACLLLVDKTRGRKVIIWEEVHPSISRTGRHVLIRVSTSCLTSRLGNKPYSRWISRLLKTCKLKATASYFNGHLQAQCICKMLFCPLGMMFVSPQPHAQGRRAAFLPP